MTNRENIVNIIMKDVGRCVQTEVCHAPAASAGEKIIYRYSPGKYEGDFEEFSLTMRFISKDINVAMKRADAASRYICMPEDKPRYTEGELPVYVTRAGGGGSGYIGRTGHFFVLMRFIVRRRLESSVKTVVGSFN